MEQQKQKQLTKISQKKYNQRKKQLDLSFENEIWSEVLLIRDWTEVRTLKLVNCGITSHSIKILNNFNWSNLGWLNLSNNMLGSNGVKILTKLYLPNLEILYIYQCGIKSQGIKHLSKGNWPNLNKLYLALYKDQSTKIDNKIQLDGWQMMMHLHNWKKLFFLQFYEKQPICWTNSILLKKSKIKIFQYHFQIQNKQLVKSIKEIIRNRGLLNNFQ